MIRTGIASVSFRALKADEIICLSQKAGLDGIEWGGDIHVPHGNIVVAEKVKEMSRDAGLECPSYGSYYRAGELVKEKKVSFDAVLDSALALGARTIRIWAGVQSSESSDDVYYSIVSDDINKVSAASSRHNISISLEYHGKTLTDSVASADKLFTMLDPAVRTYWQPLSHLSELEWATGLEKALPRLSNLHVYSWEPLDGKNIRHPLRHGAENWKTFLGTASELPGERYAHLEFFKDDSPDQFLEDAATLKNIILSVQL
ncbi:MAG TPA: sugar phosphate isomerase/epimerase [Lentisphaeria bacterium]|nr:MAG: hypothetical protein A2X48_17045 [Lentisphaerae bacterium GWF2_49_21]HBC88368.1 sugar phosphate isomerase/epimerase [Lentisphaeria bacterium]